MRSELVYSAALRMENRFLLAATIISAVKKLHVTSTRVEDTTNEVLIEVACGLNAGMPLKKEPPVRPAPDGILFTPVA